jgi:CBS domain containing-hemolysin-like protein
VILAFVGSILLLVGNGFFVAAEFSLIAARKSQLEASAAAGDARAAAAARSVGELSFMLSASQLGVTFCSVLLGFLAEPTVANLLEGPFEDVGLTQTAAHTVAFIIALSVVVFLHLVFGEMVPKYLAMSAPDRAALLLAVPMRGFATLFRPVVRALTVTARFLLGLLRVEQQDQLSEARTGDEIANMLAHSRREGLLEEVEHRLMTGALRFPVRLVQSVVVPWDDVVRVPAGATAAEVREVAVASGHSRIVVHGNGDGDSADSALGFVHAKDLLRIDTDAEGRSVPPDLVRRMLVVPADRTLQHLLLAMRRERIHVALVLGAGDGVVGVVTLEDVLEALVGDIRDEHDARMP